MHSRSPSGPSGDIDPLENETNARVLDHQPNGMIQAITENGLYLIRIRTAVAAGQTHSPGTSLELSTVNVLGRTRHRDLTVMAQAELKEVVKGVLTDCPEMCLSFYNRAGNLTLKMHSFQLLNGIGNSKALSMVEERGRTGWETIQALDEACEIDSADLLADRLCQELADSHMTPNLLELLIRA
tara:strand:- start:4096 stop:4647 length:552 start_codon:yes stop_codon:yes gene_type:complete